MLARGFCRAVGTRLEDGGGEVSEKLRERELRAAADARHRIVPQMDDRVEGVGIRPFTAGLRERRERPPDQDNGGVAAMPAGEGNRQIVHYGGDNGTTSKYRKGTMLFYQNTVVSTRTDRTTLFRLSTNDEAADARNNIFYPSAHTGPNLQLLDATAPSRPASRSRKFR